MPQNSQQNSFYIIDAHGFLHRAYHALPKFTASSGEEVGALYGFTRLLLKLLREKKPAGVAVCFDSPGKTFRHGMFSDYKANRSRTDDALVSQLRLARDIAAGLGLKVLAAEGYEADDLMACAAQKGKAAGMDTVLVTTDKDALQLIGGGISIWTGDAQAPRGEDFVRAKYGVEPRQLADYFALVGDSSDNVPGVRGIGPKMAQKLVAACGSLETMLEKARAGDPGMDPGAAKKLLEQEKQALLSKRLVTLDCEVSVGEIPDFAVKTPDPAKIAELAKRFEFKDLFSLAQAGAAVSFTQIPKAGGWDAALARLPEAKEFFFQAADGCVLAGFSAQDYAYKAVDELTPADRAALKAAVQNPALRKTGWYIKEALRFAGIKLDKDCALSCLDLALAAYCLNPSRPNYDFAALAAEYAGAIVPAAKPPETVIWQNMFAWELARGLDAKLAAEGVERLYREMEMPLIAVLSEMENAGIAVDMDCLRRAGTELAARMEAAQSKINEAAGSGINVNSPKQLAFLLFEKLGLKPLRKTKTGYSTDEEVLAALAPAHTVPGLILEYREAAKLKSAYIDNLTEMAVDGRVHTRFDQTGTATGRLSSLQPNLQNIPVRGESGRAVRRAFVAKEGCALLSADYSQIDLRVLAHESGDETLVRAFIDGGDIHVKTAAEVFDAAPALVTADMRRAAKTINFGIVYGQGAPGLALQLGISRQEAQKYIEHYFATYKGVKAWIDATTANARRDGLVRTMSGRLRRLPEFASANGATASFAQRAAVNTVVQGGSADVIKKAMLEIHRLLARESAAMLLQVHDELVFEIPKSDLRRLAPQLKHLMETAYQLKVPLLADMKCGENWRDMKPFPPEPA
ncbi:MAG: DNA polymerase I [Elusimicrobiales bacterium]|nr:DNA polymerase I [Elusimicrobiales bacterium]